MIRLKIVSIAALALVLGSLGMVSAQERPAGERGAGQRGAGERGQQGGQVRPGMLLERIYGILEPLNLSEAQKKQLDDVLANHRTKMRETMQGLRDASPEERREKMRSAIDALRADVKSLLTEEQKAQLGDKLDGAGLNGPGQPSTQPATRPAGGRAGMMFERVRATLKEIGVSDEQKARIDPILDQAAKDFAAIREKNADNMQNAREELRMLMSGTMEKVLGVLDPDQQRAFREKMEQTAPAGAGGGGRVDAGSGPGGAGPADEMMMMDQMKSPPTGVATAVSGGSVVAREQRPLLDPGTRAPAISLMKLDGKAVSLETYQGKPLVVVFGSFTCPIFRDKAPALEKFRSDNRTKANFVVVYTREAHALGEWEVQRNKDENIQVKQAATLEEREKMARSCRDGLKLEKWDWVVDKLDDAVTSAYSGAPNGAAVIDPSGQIVGQLKWAEVTAMQRLLDQAIVSRK